MVTAMDMANSICLNILRIVSLLAVLAASRTFAADVEISPTASSELTYSDNINLAPKDQDSGIVSTWSAGVAADVKGNEGNLSFDYDIYQTFHSIDSNRNELFNELALSGNKKIYRDNIEFSTSATITNIARSIEDNAEADIISGDTIETRFIEAQVSYQSNPRGYVDLYAAIDGSVTSNQDNIGDFYSVGTNVVFQDGSAAKRYFWLTDYQYNRNISGNTDNVYDDFSVDQEFGLQPVKGISPLIRVFYEGYTSGEDGKIVESGSWGPAVRYYFHKRSYIELGYDFSFKDEDFWSGALELNPTPRTLLTFDFTRRFYGDAYDFSLRHQSRKVTNSITYSEELTGFDREFFIEGENIEEYQLVKELSLNSAIALRRTSLNLEVRAQERMPLSTSNERGKSKLYGGTVSASHSVSDTTSLSGSFQYDRNQFNSESQKPQVDYYRIYDVSLDNQLSNSLSWDLSFIHTRSSKYKENRANVNFSIDY